MNLLIADSNEIIRIGLRTILASQPQFSIVGEATNNNEVLDILKNFPVDVVIMDYTADGFSIDVILEIKSKFKSTGIVAITPDQSAQTLINALKSGVNSYIKKDCDVSEIINSVKDTSEGKKFFCGQILKTIQRSEIDVEDVDLNEFTCDEVVLSEREIEIIILIAEGHTNNQIADHLNLSHHTVNTHRKNIMHKLGVKNTAAIVIYAVKTGLVTPNKFLFSAER